jgi:hypothetical protein
MTWGLLAVGGFGYLVSLVWHGETKTAAPTHQQAAAEPDASMRTATRALAEIGAVRRNVGELQSEVGQLKETVGKAEDDGKAVQSRLSALEERVTSMSVQAAAPEPPVKQKVSETHKPATDRAQRVAAGKASKTGDTRATTRTVADAAAPGAKAAGTPAIIETSSIAHEPIKFGEAVVMPAPQIFAVQLASGPSLDSLRVSWSSLLERYGSELATLQPRYLPPRIAGGTYRLVAGPLASAAEAERICIELQAQRTSCLSTPFAGEPL